MLRKILHTAIKTSITGVDLFDSLVKRGESFVFGEQKSTRTHEPRQPETPHPPPVSSREKADKEDQESVQHPQPNREESAGQKQEPMVEPAEEETPARQQEDAKPVLPQRQKAPPICLKTIISKRTVCFNAIGKPAVLIFHGQANANEAAVVNSAIQEKFFSQTSVFVANIVPLRIVPFFLRRIAEQEMVKAYHKGIKRFIDGRYPISPEDVIFIFPDWRNELVDAFRLGDTWQEIGIVVLDRDGGIIGKYQGGYPAQKALELLQDSEIF